MKKIVIVAPHTDDETLGAGGYILKHKALGDQVYWINVTNAKTDYGYTEEEVLYWQDKLTSVSKAFAFDAVYDLGFEPAGLDRLGEGTVISAIRKVIDQIQPNIVLVPYYGDTHSDHEIVFRATMACCKAFRCTSIEKIMCMEIISETDYAIKDMGFVPDYFVDITDYIEEKLNILSIYESEIKASPFPRNIEAVRGLAKYRGAACNAHYAEAFRIMKIIER